MDRDEADRARQEAARDQEAVRDSQEVAENVENIENIDNKTNKAYEKDTIHCFRSSAGMVPACTDEGPELAAQEPYGWYPLDRR